MDYVKAIKKIYSYAEFYNCEFCNYKDDIYFWEHIVEKYHPKVLMEIGIGTGRIIELLHDKTAKYIGVEISKNLIEFCKNKYRYDNLELYNADIRDFYIDTGVDMIILPFNVINNFYTEKDFDNLFSCLQKMCNSNTLIVIDTFNPTDDDLKDVEKYRITHSFNLDGKDINVWEKHKYNKRRKTNIYYKKYESEGKKLLGYVLPNRIIFKEELRSIISRNKFEIINEFGDYNQEALTSHSRKYIAVLRRKEV